jgi:hypothetical protein
MEYDINFVIVFVWTNLPVWIGITNVFVVTFSKESMTISFICEIAPGFPYERRQFQVKDSDSMFCVDVYRSSRGNQGRKTAEFSRQRLGQADRRACSRCLGSETFPL